MRFKVQDIDNERFFQMPKSLFSYAYYKDLSLQAKVIYCLLRDRMELSRRNRWVDENGDIYLIFQQKDIGEALCISESTVSREMARLKEYRLIETRKFGCGLAQQIYVNKVRVPDSEEDISRAEERLESVENARLADLQVMVSNESARLADSQVRLAPAQVRLVDMQVRLAPVQANDTDISDTEERETENSDTNPATADNRMNIVTEAAKSLGVSTAEYMERRSARMDEVRQEAEESLAAAENEHLRFMELCRSLGLDKGTLALFEDMYGLDKLEEKVEILHNETKTKTINNPGGWLRRALEYDYHRVDHAKAKEERHQQNILENMKKRRQEDKRNSLVDMTVEELRERIKQFAQEIEEKMSSGEEMAKATIPIWISRKKKLEDELQERERKQKQGVVRG